MMHECGSFFGLGEDKWDDGINLGSFSVGCGWGSRVERFTKVERVLYCPDNNKNRSVSSLISD